MRGEVERVERDGVGGWGPAGGGFVGEEVDGVGVVGVGGEGDAAGVGHCCCAGEGWFFSCNWVGGRIVSRMRACVWEVVV